MPPTTFERATRRVGTALLPVVDMGANPELLLRQLHDLGWQAPPGVDFAQAFNVDAQELYDALVRVITATPEERDDPWTMAGLYAELLLAANDVVAAVAAAADRLPEHLAAAGDYAAKTNIAAEFPRRLLDYLVGVALQDTPPFVSGLLQLAGVVQVLHFDRDDAIYQADHERVVVDYGRLVDLLSRPQDVMASEYAWGTAGFDADRLLANVGRLLEGLAIPALTEDHELLVAGADERLPFPFGLAAHRVAAGPTDPDAGIEVVPRVGAGGSVDLTETLALRLDTDLQLDAAVALELRPSGVRLRTNGLPDTAGRFALAARYTPLGGEPHDALLLFGGTRLRVGEASVELGGEVRPSVEPDAFVRAHVQAELSMAPGSGDGFIQQVLPGGFAAEFDVGLRWSRRTGLAFEGAGMLDLAIPVHQRFGPVALGEIHLALGANQQGLRFVGAATGSLLLGPVTAAVKDIGVQAALRPEDGNLGPVDLDLGFKPPDGAALSIDAGPVTGGGFLFFDPAREQYAGGLHLEFEKLTLDAIGLLTTRMPDGSRGFSLLVIVRASGFAPIPLGFGFALTGVGGLLGINRTVAVDVLRAGVRNQTLDSILFSKDDPTPRAPQIVSTLQTVFPPAAGRYVFGPMAQIGWGPPNAPVLLIEVALLLELPAPLRLIILGRIRAGLPQPDKAIVRLNLDVVGIIDFDRRQLSVDASLFDSFVGPFALTGDMAARANWGERPDFALSLGGFHPAFTPPAGFPALRRLALTLSTSDNPRLRMEAYLAMTSNTVQLGARLDFYVAVAGFSLEGGFGFDALMQLSPFRLQAELDAGLTLKKGSRTLMHLGIHVNIVGPSPWEVWGEAKFKLLFISITVPFRARFGRPEALPEAERTDVWALLTGELAKPENWRSELPAADNRLATLIGEPAAGEALAHPLGALTVNQRSVPLERTLSMFGTAPPREASRFEITGATGLQQGGDLYDWFAPAQFRRMTDAEKLASPAFDQMVSGAALGPSSGTVAMGHVQPTPLDYETIVVVDLDNPVRETADDYVPSADDVGAMAERGPAAVAALRDQGRAKFAPEATGPAVGDPEYVVATRDTLQVTAATAHDGSYSGAVEALRRRADADRLQVVRREETELVPT